VDECKPLNMGCLADPGTEGACAEFPFEWSHWIPRLLQRFFTFFENVDSSNVGKVLHSSTSQLNLSRF